MRRILARRFWSWGRSSIQALIYILKFYPMDKIRGFTAETLFREKHESVFIGMLEGKMAIYVLPDPTFDVDAFQNLSLRATECSSTLKTRMKYIPRLMWPASQKHVEKYLKNFRYVAESYEDYKNNDDYLQTSWLDNVISGKDVNEKVFFEDEESMILGNYKWDGVSNDHLYMLMIFKDPKLRSIREVEDVGVLERARNNIIRLCMDKGLSEEDICMFFHYRPSYFRLHIHIVNISSTTEMLNPSRDVFLEDVMRNLHMKKDYYRNDLYFIGFE